MCGAVFDHGVNKLPSLKINNAETEMPIFHPLHSNISLLCLGIARFKNVCCNLDFVSKRHFVN